MYPYGASVEDAYRKLQYDLYYIKNHDIIFDMKILLKTVTIVIFGKGRQETGEKDVFKGIGTDWI